MDHLIELSDGRSSRIRDLNERITRIDFSNESVPSFAALFQNNACNPGLSSNE
jgi:hypothetical protein